MLCSVDATEEPLTGPKLGRLVNHGKKERNAVMKVLCFDCGPVLCLFAVKDIAVGEQLLYDYGVKVPWEQVSIDCVCRYIAFY